MESWRGEGGDAADAGAVAGSCPHKSVRGGGGVGGWEVAQREPIRGLTLCRGVASGISFSDSGPESGTVFTEQNNCFFSP